MIKDNFEILCYTVEEYNLAIKSSVGIIDIYVQSHGHYKQEYIMLSALATCRLCPECHYEPS